MKNLKNFIDNRNRDLPNCSKDPEQTELPHTPNNVMNSIKTEIKEQGVFVCTLDVTGLSHCYVLVSSEHSKF